MAISSTCHSEGHAVYLVFVSSLVLPEGGVSFEQLVQHAPKREPVSWAVICCALAQHLWCHVPVSSSVLRKKTFYLSCWKVNEVCIMHIICHSSLLFLTHSILPHMHMHVHTYTQFVGYDMLAFDTYIQWLITEMKLKICTYTDACGFFFEKSQANPKSDILTWPCSSRRMFAGFKSL